jgi:hypothetical protein
MNGVTIRPALESDRAFIFEVEQRAFGQQAEAWLVEQLVTDGDAVLELVAERPGGLPVTSCFPGCGSSKATSNSMPWLWRRSPSIRISSARA